eukprot:4735760-Alexandrium_andersonii.AAC.1
MYIFYKGKVYTVANLTLNGIENRVWEGSCYLRFGEETVNEADGPYLSQLPTVTARNTMVEK